MKDTPEVRDFMSAWHSLYMQGQLKGMSYDQPSLLAVNMTKKMIFPMDGIYNCQILNGGLPFLSDAKIIHAYNAFGNNPFYGLTNPAFYRKIKEQGALGEDDKVKILSAKRQFAGEYALVYGTSLPYWHSSLRHLYLDSPKQFKFLEFLSRIFRKFFK